MNIDPIKYWNKNILKLNDEKILEQSDKIHSYLNDTNINTQKGQWLYISSEYFEYYLYNEQPLLIRIALTIAGYGKSYKVIKKLCEVYCSRYKI